MFCGQITYYPPKFCAAGDSHVYGNADPANTWTVWLQQLLQNYAIYNTGHNGIGWTDMVAFYPTEAFPLSTVITRIPSFYWVDIGTNNINASQSGASIYAGVAPILATAKANGSIVGATQVWQSPGWSAGQISAVQAYNALLATDPSCSCLFDGYNTFPDPNGPYFVNSGHLNPGGQQTYAQGVFNALRAAGKI